MSDNTFINQVMDRLKDGGFLMITDDFIDQLIITLHANVTIINTMTELAELETKMLGSLLPTGSRQVESLKNLSVKIAEIAFNVEDVRNDNDNKTNLKADHGAHNRKQPHKRGLLLRFTIFMAWVAGIGLVLALVACQPVNAKLIATNDSSGYYIDLSKEHASGKPSRYLLAFFVPVIGMDSQSLSIYTDIAPQYTDIAPQAHLSASRGQTIISIANHLLTDYDGLTLQNTIAERRICRAVACVTESKTRHPILLPYSVAFTQKTTQGAIHHG